MTTATKTKKARGSSLVIEQADLAAALASVTPITRRPSSLPILKTVRWSGDRVVGTDLEAIVEVSLPSGEPGAAVCLPAVPFFELVQRLPHKPLEVTWTEIEAVLISGHERFRLRGMAAPEFPEMAPASGPSVTLPAKQLRAALSRVRYSVNDSHEWRAARPWIVGVHLAAADGRMVAEATDGYRGTRVWLEVSPEAAFNVVLPLSFVDRLVALIDEDEEEPVRLTIGERLTVEHAGRWRVTAVLVAGTFPAMDPKIRRDRESDRFQIQRTEWLDALARARTLSQEETRRIEIHCEDGMATFRATNTTTGDAAAVAGYEAAKGHKSRDVAVNGDYLRDALRHLSGNTVTVGIALPRDMILLREDGESLSFVMPLQPVV